MGIYRSIAIEVLQKSDKALTPSEIWEKAIELNLVNNANIVGKTPVATLASLLLRETNKGTYNGIPTVFSYEVSPRRYMIKFKK